MSLYLAPKKYKPLAGAVFPAKALFLELIMSVIVYSESAFVEISLMYRLVS